MRLDRIKELAEFMRENGISELELGSWFSRLRISLGGHVKVQAPPKVEELASDVEQAATTEPDTHEGMFSVDAPMVGTFYRAPAPGEAPFVSEGDRVSVGQVLCIVEAMKLMNEITAERSGTITKILVENSQPVEYGQKMFLLRQD
jgi:acetyl-CoA carboxylase biotin carboxyl carrier protein